jgi:glycosyltransferase involved in cell wall biosynthesis
VSSRRFLYEKEDEVVDLWSSFYKQKHSASALNTIRHGNREIQLRPQWSNEESTNLTLNHEHSHRGLVGWHFITGEHPPQKGGIGLYTQGISRGLATSGEDVTVWCPRIADLDNTTIEDGVAINRVMGTWTKRDFSMLGERMDACSSPRNILVQFSPTTFDNFWNHDLGPWLGDRRRKGDRVWVMVHRIHRPFVFSRGPKFWLRRRDQAKMLRNVINNADRVFVATENWISSIRPWLPKTILEPTLLPIPSSVPLIINRKSVANLRKAIAADADFIIGSLGSYTNPGILNQYGLIIPKLLEDQADRIWLFIGRNSEQFAQDLKKQFPQVARGIRSTGELDAAGLSAHLQACDIMVQPYPDGVTTRSSSIMAGMLHSRAIITSRGTNTEFIWNNADGVSMIPWPDSTAICNEIDTLIKNPLRRRISGQKAFEFYETNFSIKNTVDLLIANT